MKILIVGTSFRQNENPIDNHQQSDSREVISRIGEAIGKADHQLLICSPFNDSADYWAFNGIKECLLSGGPSAEFHYPRLPEVEVAVRDLVADLPSDRVRQFTHQTIEGSIGNSERTYSWLLAQIAAMDQSHAIVAIGGKINGSARLLLALAESRRKPVLPLRFLGGAADQYFDNHYYQLRDQLGDNVEFLSTMGNEDKVVDLIRELCLDRHIADTVNIIPKFFLSYAKQRPSEADLVETLLRRRGLTVTRDDADFEEGESITNSIKEEIYKSDVFIALWCKEYACSPWCYDELSLALQRHKAGSMTLWLICIDDTRIVHPDARDLLFISALSREKLSLEIVRLIGKWRVVKSPQP
ncbi:toll/interleukin-1 receptor domain-containing protein [Cupriavidus basilensis]|uniref:toll/interleukin-1 receptor domain-containing protein n=1 Tax=Cupriavidus basilensis TaxID=68895 RepID=UPI0023E7FA0F|nr:toll/interleukin-1 receptor domain-containing protein [Cupriavidus basilensis]MDF3883645.1 toll/interleukin-1 receptor domain-containing protein [Cupriavidus basilensis]